MRSSIELTPYLVMYTKIISSQMYYDIKRLTPIKYLFSTIDLPHSVYTFNEHEQLKPRNIDLDSKSHAINTK